MDPFIGEIRILAFDYVPMDWADCNGASIAVQQNPALYSIVGNLYGGNQVAFNLPNLQGATPIGTGTGPGLTGRVLAASGGTGSQTLTAANLAPHTHTLKAERESTEANVAAGNAPGAYMVGGTVKKIYSSATAPLVSMSAQSLAPAGQAIPVKVDNSQPYLVMRFCIALQGVYPVRP